MGSILRTSARQAKRCACGRQFQGYARQYRCSRCAELAEQQRRVSEHEAHVALNHALAMPDDQLAALIDAEFDSGP